MIQLRPYQWKWVQDIQAAWLTVRSVLGVLATGGGKTVCFAWLMHEHVGACAAVVHRKEIVSQISCALAKLDVKHRVIAPPNVVALIRRKHLRLYKKSFIDPHAKAGVISVQTLTSKASKNNSLLQKWLQQITLAVFDEGHHYIKSGLWGRAVEMFDKAKLLFVTATPERADGKGLGAHADGYAETMVQGPSTQWLIERGYLSPFTYKAPRTDLDISNIPVTASGELNTRIMRTRIVKSHLVGDVVRHYHTFAAGKRCIVFANDVETAEEHAAAFRASGVSAVALNGGSEQADRDRECERFESGELTVLINVDLFDEGFDVPGAEAVIMARKTESLAKFLQMIGRVLRTFDGKTEAIVIDPVRNWERHGMPNWPRVWSMTGREKGTRKAADDLIPQRVCAACTQPYEAFYKICPYCGHAPMPAGRAAPEQVDGDLMELDVAAMTALFVRMQAADMSDEDYAVDQIARNIPHIGRSADMKRHQEAKYRRRVLRELVGWWVGFQTARRDMSEIHRRFYYRFGIDIGTAFTLNAQDTDALANKIQLHFGEDMA